MSDLEIVVVMLCAYSRNELDSTLEKENEVDLGSNGPRRDLTANCKDFRSVLNTTIRANSEATNENAILITSEVTTQITRKLEELFGDKHWSQLTQQKSGKNAPQSKLPSKLTKRDFRQKWTKGSGI